jgi:integrase
MATIRRRGGKWNVQVRRNGVKTSRTFTRRADALQWARGAELTAERQGAAIVARCEGTLGGLLDRYASEIVPRKKSAHNESRFVANLKGALGSIRLGHLTPAHVARYRDTRLESVSGSTVLRELAVLQHALQVARREWGIPIRNVAQEIRKPTPNPARDRRLQPGELESLIGQCQNSLLRNAIVVAVETGLRRSELLRLEWRHINLMAGTLYISESKNGHPRTVALTPKAMAVLSTMPNTYAKVFPITANALRLAWERLVRRVGIENLRWHDLRHEAISRFFEMGLNAPEVALISGHRDPRMLFRYTHPRAEDVARKLKARENNFEARHIKAAG